MAPSKKRLKIVSGIFSLIVVTLVVLFFLPQLGEKTAGTKNNHDLTGPASSPEAVPIKVEAALARIGDLVMRLSATGLIRALREITVSPKVGGQIVQLAIEEGMFVRKGMLLMKLDDREYALARTEAKDKLLGVQVEFGLLLRDEERGAWSVER